MSLSFWFILSAIIGICVFVFTKTVSSDAKNDYRIRDILANAKSEAPKPEPAEEPVPVAAAPKQSFEEYQNEHNVYEELVAKQKEAGYQSYSTTTHEDKKEEEQFFTQEKVYYEKINDDACPVEETKDIYRDEEEPEIKPDKKYSETLYDEVDEDYTPKKKQYKSLSDYVKTFWKGITFTIGLLVCLYAFGGLAYNVQTSNDAIVYSIWLLIGVILIK
ncbi:MAG: hypothetical protein K6E29_04700 [Cyanobacteria bacterium RUI128]|nr:hypothetical protein [Cyanobacteria bacterium RUI128]